MGVTGNSEKRIVLGLVALVALASGVLIASGSAAGGKSHRLILSPRSGKGVPAQPTFLRVHTGKKSRVFRAQLNGHPIAKYFSTPSRHGVRKLEVSLSYGLRYGRNRLHVRVGRHRSEWSRFRVWRGRPLVGAGVDRTVAVGSQVYLQGRVASAARRDAARSGSRLTARGAGAGSTTGWSLKSAPRDSPPKGPTGAAGRNAKFTPEVPGRYTLRLSGKWPDGQRGADTVGLTVLPDPSVPVDTMAKEGGQSGVKVGDQFYPGSSQKWLQLLVLKADTLEKVSNKSYDCPQATANPKVTDRAAVKPCTDELSSDLNALKASKQRDVVIAVSQPPNGQIERTPAWQTQPPVGVLESLHSIGAPATIPWRNPQTPMLRGRFSIIGSLGGVSKTGTLHWNPDLNDLRDDGKIEGFLLRDNKGELRLDLDDEYSTYASSEHPRFDTQAPGSNATLNVIQIGDINFYEPIPPNSDGGFQVVIVDRQDLVGRSYFFNTGGHGPSDCPSCTALDELNRMTDTISSGLRDGNSDGRGVLVFIAGLGDARLHGAGPSAGPVLQRQFDDAAKRLVDLLTTRLGATRSRAYRALDPGLTKTSNWSYSLVAENGTPPAQGVEAEGPRRSGLNGVPLIGSLTRSAIDYGFELEPSQVGDELGGPGVKLRDIVFSDPGPWPEQSNGGCKAYAGDSDPSTLDNEGCKAAVAYISDQTSIGTKRELFWSEAYDPSDWDSKSKEISKLKRPGKANFSAADFAWAQGELTDEIGWLKLAHAFASKLAQPFARNQLSAWSDVGSLAEHINNDVKAPNNSTEAEAWLVFDAAREFAAGITGEIPLISIPIETANILYDTVGEWTKIDAEGTEADDPFSVQAADAGAQIQKRLQLAQDTLQRQMVDVIASDYRKLRTVALCENLNKACPDPPLDEWQIPPTYQSKMAEAINAGVHVSIYNALLPAKYRAWAPDPSPNRSINWNGNQPAGQDIFAWHCPFHDEPQSANFAYPIRPDVGSSGGGSWQVIAYAQRTGTGLFRDPYEMTLPDAKITNPLFKPLSEGGYEVLPEDFYWNSFGSDKTNPFSAPGGGTESQWGFPLRDSQVRWISQHDPAGFKAPSCGY